MSVPAPRAGIGLGRLRRRYRLHGPLHAAPHLGALPAGEHPLERVVVRGTRSAAVRPRHVRQYQPVLCEWLHAPHGSSVAAGDVPEAPRDLRRRVRLPVGAGTGHLAAGKRLRDAVRSAAGVVGVDAPAGLPVPQGDEARELVVSPAASLDHLVRDRLRATGVGRHERRAPPGGGGLGRLRRPARPSASA